MHPEYFGDSYDLVKRFFIQELKAIGYSICVDPMLTGHWNELEDQFFKLIGAPKTSQSAQAVRRAMFVDPDTGINSKGGKAHVSFQVLAEHACSNAIVFAFDQSFSRQHKPKVSMLEKLGQMHIHGCYGMYYDSHARFLFISKCQGSLKEFKAHLVSIGLPITRLVESAA